MSKSLTFKDLSEQGVALTKEEAIKLQPHISKISQHGSDGLNEIEFEKGSTHTAEQGQHNTGQANNVKDSTGFEPKGDEGQKDEPVVQKKLVAGNFNKKGNTLAADGYKIGDMYPRIEKKESNQPEMIDHIVTQEDLDNNAELVANNVKVGDTIQLPKEPDTVQ